MNPKIDGSNIVECIPQTGKCPVNCYGCYYNNGFYRNINEPVFPDKSTTKIVRINSGNDSNNNADHVIETTKDYLYKFYNTSIPNLEKLNQYAPVVYTINPAGIINNNRFDIGNIKPMFIRFIAYDDNSSTAIDVIKHFSDIPVVITFFRFPEEFAFNERKYKNINYLNYVFRKSIINDYWQMTDKSKIDYMNKLKNYRVFMCGAVWSNLCMHCNTCEYLYWEHMRKYKRF